MKVEVKFLIVVAIAAIISAPVAYAMRHKTHQIKIEKAQNDTLRIELDTKAEQLEKQQQQIEAEQQKNADLEKQLQSKREAQEAEKKLAQAQQQAPVVASGGSCEAYRGLVAQYDWDVNTALAIMRAESGCNPIATSPTNDHGLMQINQGLGIYGQQIYDPAFNISVAYNNKYKKGGWSHWTVYNSGAYLKYL